MEKVLLLQPFTSHPQNQKVKENFLHCFSNAKASYPAPTVKKNPFDQKVNAYTPPPLVLTLTNPVNRIDGIGVVVVVNYL